MRVDVELDTGRRIVQDWPLEKVAYFIFASDTPLPKFENALREEWVSYYICRASWDKSLITNEDYERISAPWPRVEAHDIRPDDVHAVRVLYEVGGRRGSCGLGRAIAPVLFRQILDAACPTAIYRSFDCASNKCRFETRIRSEFVPQIIASVFGTLEARRTRPDNSQSDVILFEDRQTPWRSPFTFIMQEAAL